MSPKNIRLFSLGRERMLLILGILPAFVLFWDPKIISTTWELNFLSEILFLNTIHNIFSIYIIWRSTEIQRAIKIAYKGQTWKLHLTALIIFFTSIALLYLYEFNNQSNVAFIFSVAIFLNFIATHHEMSQQLGFSLMYDSKLKNERSLADAEVEEVARLAKLEKFFHKFALIGIIIRSTTDVLRKNSINLPLWILWLGHVIFIIGSLGILGSVFMRPQWCKSNQWIYNMRRIIHLFPFVNIHLIALKRLNHAFEYTLVTMSIDENSIQNKSKFQKYKAPLFLVLYIFIAFFALHRIVYRLSPTPFEWIRTDLTYFFSMVSAAMTLVHYYYDSKIYKFSNPVYRDNILSLIIQDKKYSK